MKHVNPTFSIQAPKINFANAQLFVEAGPMGVSLVVLDTNNYFKAVVTYAFATALSDPELAQKLKEIFSSENLLQKKYDKTHIFWCFAESILVPAGLMNAERNVNMLKLVFGDASQGIIKSDFLYKHNLHNVYRIPQTIVDVFSNSLPVATQTHLYTTIANIHLPEGNHLFTVFYGNSITAMLCRDGKLQVIQNFAYAHPDDCVFHLLNICKSFDVPAESVTLHINGMIDEKSGLYELIYKYFLKIELDTLPEGYTYHETIKAHPPHFFSHLFALASCV